jgi:hypothetical protein
MKSLQNTTKCNLNIEHCLQITFDQNLESSKVT